MLFENSKMTRIVSIHNGVPSQGIHFRSTIPAGGDWMSRQWLDPVGGRLSEVAYQRGDFRNAPS